MAILYCGNHAAVTFLVLYFRLQWWRSVMYTQSINIRQFDSSSPFTGRMKSTWMTLQPWYLEYDTRVQGAVLHLVLMLSRARGDHRLLLVHSISSGQVRYRGQ